MSELDLIKHLAGLSKIRMNDEQLLKKSKEMQEIIALMDEIKEFSLPEGVMSVNAAVSYGDLREDAVRVSFPREEIVKNAKAESDGYFTVPKVVE